MATVNLNNNQFQTLLAEGKTILVDFWAPWCGYCRRIAPAYEKLAQERDDIIFAKVNIDEEPLLANDANIEVIPTLVLYKEGKAVDFVIAPNSKLAIEKFIEQGVN
ncbi:MAG: thioredoxin family protein [Oscillospiraceae bacterium]|nr:thioredoxin family protein [Oscillospiraceae bacterium]